MSMMVVLEAGERELTLLRAEELVRAARQMAALEGGEGPQEFILVLAGAAPVNLAGEIAEQIGLDLIAMALPQTASWDLLTAGLEDLVETHGPAMVLFAHTTLAREAGPALALARGGVSVSNVSAVTRAGDAMVFTRPVMDNARLQDVRVAGGTFIAVSLAPGAVVAGSLVSGPVVPDAVTPGAVTQDAMAPRGRVSEYRPPAPAGLGLTRISLTTRCGGGTGKLGRAPIVVAAGRGIGERENLERVRAFAACFSGAVTAASRPLVDQGWVAYERQVGITGAVVSPELYIALGISGSSQHLAGMAGSKWVVSVNKNPDAPICRHSDLCIRADVPAFLEAYLSAAGNRSPGKG